MALPLSIFFLSASILSFEIIVIRFLAISHWQPFVTLAISTALLGYGLSGSALVRFRNYAFSKTHLLYPALAAGAAVAYRPVIHVSSRLHLDPGLIIRDPGQWLKVGLLIAVLTLPFILASAALALPLLKRESVGRYYGWNFLGAAAGVAAAGTSLATLHPEQLPGVPAFLAGLALLASLLHYHRGRNGLLIGAAATVSATFIFPYSVIVYGPYKDISYALRLPSAKVAAERYGITGMFQVVGAPALRSAAGLSTKYRGELPSQAALYRSGDRAGTLILTESSHDEQLSYLDWQTSAAPYTLLVSGSRTAIVGFDGGEEAARSLYHGSTSPAVIEPDTAIEDLIRGNPHLFSPWIFGPGGAVIVSNSPRPHMAARSSIYDLIVYPAGINLASAEAGLTGTAENYELTVQGLKAALGNLSGGGMIAITGWNRYPPTGRWKLLSLFGRIKGLSVGGKFGGRVFLISGWSTHTFLIRPSAFRSEELERLSVFCMERGFTLIDGDYFPGPEETKAVEGRQVWTDDLDLRHPTDSRPYPWHSLKFSYLKHLKGAARETAFPRVEWGFFFLIMVLFLTSVISLAALALSRPRGAKSGGIHVNLYFACLGMGYMTLEILLIKRSCLILAPPEVTAGVVLASFMAGSGFGSHAAGRAMLREHNPWWAFPAVIVLSGAVYLAIPTLLPLPALLRALPLFFMIAAPAFFMGFPFPSALMVFTRDRESLVPWAWSLNGYTSVIGSSLAGVLAVTTGYNALFALGAGCYLVAWRVYETGFGVNGRR